MTYPNALPASLVTLFNLADRVAACGSAAADRAITVWSFLTQPQAIATYKWLGRMALALIELVIWSAIWAYAQVTKRFEPTHQFVSVEEILAQNPGAPWPILDYSAQVTDAIADMTDAEIEAEFNDSFELPDDEDEMEALLVTILNPPAQAQSMTAPIATLRLALSTSHEDYLDREDELKDMTLAQLKPIAAKLSLPIRKVRKANLITRILKAEGYEV